MNSDMVKPMPASAPAPTSWRQEYSRRLDPPGPSRTASADAPMKPSGLPMTSPATIASISGPWPPNTSADDHDARIGQREQRQHDVARARAGVAQQPVGGRLEAVVDRVERAQRRHRRAVPQHARRHAALRPRGSCSPASSAREVRRRPRRDEQREHHARERRVQAARVHAGPQRDAEQHVRRARDRRASG